MADLPVMLKVRGIRCVIVGGGAVARRRAVALLEAGARVAVIAPDVDEQLADMDVRLERRGYEPGDLEGARLVVIATDDPALNQRIADDAQRLGVLVNRADAPEAGDLSIPAHAHHGPLTLSVHTAGISAAAAAAIRRELSDALDPDWPRLLEAVADYRRELQRAVPDALERQARLRRLTDPEAMRILKARGLAALHAHCRKIVTEQSQP